MAYTPINWVDNVTDVNATNLNHMDAGIDANDAAIEVLDGRVDALEAQPPIPPVVNGKWIKGVGGAMVWSDITIADVASLQAALDAKVDDTEKGAASGVATLDSGSRLVQKSTVDKIYSVGEVEGTVPTVRSGATVWEVPAAGSDLNYMDDWDNGAQYKDGDIVIYNGVLNMCVEDSVVGQPPENWGV
jgi:hypothetical protein